MLTCLGVIAALALGAYGWGVGVDGEYVHWLTIWRASRAKTDDGFSVADLVLQRAKSPAPHPHWHTCGWCPTVYSHTPHTPMKVALSASEAYLFDWDPKSNRLLPMTMHTAELFPELIPPGYAAEQCSEGGLDGQLQSDRPCRIVVRRNTK